MKIVIFGATGMAGTAVVAEAARRGHHVTAVSRHPATTPTALVTPIAADLTDPDAVATALADVDAAVLTIRFPPGHEHQVVPLTGDLLTAAQQAGVRVLVIGGSAPLHPPHDPSIRLIDDPTYVPAQWRSIAQASLDQFLTCQRHDYQNWSYLSPAATFEPGTPTGHYRRGGDTLLTDPSGASRITPADLAQAVIDELEHPTDTHHFTVIEEPR